MIRISKIVPILCLTILAIVVSGCMGYQVVGPSPNPTATPVPTPLPTQMPTATPIPLPVSYFTANPTFGTAPLVVNFQDGSSNNPTSWVWSFGDGSTSTDRNPMHAYSNPGTYTVSLTVTNAGGSNTNSFPITVNAAPTAQVVYVTQNPTPAPTQQPTQQATPNVDITAFDYSINYVGDTTGYFGPTSQVASTQPYQTNGGAQFTDTVTLISSATMFSHTVDSISILTPGFTLVSITPSLPSNKISPGSSIAYTLTIQTPSGGYTGPLNLQVTTT